MRRFGKSKHVTFWLYFVPFIIIWATIIMFDVLASGFYLVEYFVVFGVDGLMRLMEIENTVAMRPVLEQLPFATRTLPSMIMFAAASKCLAFFAISVLILVVFPKAAWQVSKQNHGAIVIHKTRSRRSLEPLEDSTAVVAPAPHTVTVAGARMADEVDDDSTYDPQPAFNPHVTAPKETHF